MNAEEFKEAIDAVDLTASDAKEQILALNQGLMSSNDKLITEFKANKTRFDDVAAANDIAEAARKKAVEAEEARLQTTNDMDGLKTFYESQLAEQVATANQLAKTAQDALTDRDKGSVINDILSSVDDRYKNFVKTQLEGSVSIDYVDGKAVTSIQDGDAQYATSKDFLDGVKDSEAWKHVLKATSLSGANTQQSTSTIKNENFNSEAEKAKEKGDLTGFLQASLKR